MDWHSSSSQQSSKPFGSIGGPSGPTSRDPWGSSDRKSDSNTSWGRADGNPGERLVAAQQRIVRCFYGT